MINDSVKIKCSDLEDTKRLAKSFSNNIKNGVFACLFGEIGAGKTAFVKFIAKEFGITEKVTSPSFVILNEYKTENKIPFYHFDVYRIADIEEMYEIGYEDYFEEGACVLEWASIIKELIPEDAVWIKISKDLEKGFDYRRIDIDGLDIEI